MVILGIVRPICFAALRLMINSNFFGCSIGKITRLGAFEDLVHIGGGTAIHIGDVGAVSRQTAGDVT